jgi:histidyl-tRNA synthetase
MSFLSTQPYKGTRDFYPEDKRIQNWMFSKVRQCLELFGYQEYDGPMLEPFEVYAAKTGEEIVNQQLYWLMDRGERKMAIRPEMTPTLARMVAGKLQELPKPIRWFSIPNLYRYERPQRGRLREHWQLNVDVLGGNTQLADIEIVTLALELFATLKGEKFFSIHVNNRRLMDHFFYQVVKLTEEQGHQVSKAIDARAKLKPEEYQAWLAKIGVSAGQSAEIDQFLSSNFDQILQKYPCQGTEELGVLFSHLKEKVVAGQLKFDPTIMRGFDYYTGLVFEGYDISPENRRALFGGGRYDNLVGLFGKNKLSGIGFGLGDVTLRDFLEVHQLLPTFSSWADVYIGVPDAAKDPVAKKIAYELRATGISCLDGLDYAGFGAHLKNASKLKCRFAVLMGDDEWKAGEVTVKNLETGAQERVKFADVARKIPQRA